MKYLAFFLLVTIAFSCQKDKACPTNIQAWGDQYLVDSFSDVITTVDYPAAIVFRDSAGATFEYRRYVMGERIEKKIYDFPLECENGGTTFPFVNREIYELGYASVDGLDSIQINVESFPILRNFDTFEELSPRDNSRASVDLFSVRLSFSGCPLVHTYKMLHTYEQESLLRNSPFRLRKFGQIYDDIYGIERSWSNEVWLSYSLGIVGFNYCGKDYAQIVN